MGKNRLLPRRDIRTSDMYRKVRLDLVVCMAQHPDAHLSWDGNCPAGDTRNMLVGFSYDSERNVIELEFD